MYNSRLFDYIGNIHLLLAFCFLFCVAAQQGQEKKAAGANDCGWPFAVIEYEGVQKRRKARISLKN